MTYQKLLFAVAIVVGFSLNGTLQAQVSLCSNMDGIASEIVTYYGPFSSNDQDPRANPRDRAHTVHFQGLLYYPAGGPVKGAPVIIFVHGHEQARPEICGLARFFVKKGFVVFGPLRRGYESSLGFKSTGIYQDDYVNLCDRTQFQALQEGGNTEHLYCSSVYCRQDVSCDDPHKRNAIDLYYLRQQHDDVGQSVNYIKSLPAIKSRTGKLADPSRIVILGHSYGGGATIFTNEHDYGQSVAIAVSAGELSWGDGSKENEPNNPYWEIDLSDAMRHQQQPIYLLQPKNGRSLDPMSVLFGIAITRKYRSQAAIFAPVPVVAEEDCTDVSMACWDPDTQKPKPEYKQAHELIMGSSQIEIWGPSAINFINRFPRKQ